MKRYIPISPSSEPEDIGVRNGVFQCEILSNKFADSSSYNQLESLYDSYEFDAKKPRSVPGELIIEHCQFLPKAIHTDFIQFSPYLIGCPFILSERAYSLLRAFNLSDTAKFLRTYLYNPNGRKIEQDFFLLFQDFQLNSAIDFSQSVFYTGHEALNNKLYVPINSPQDYKQQVPLTTEEITMTDKFESSLDLFTTRLTTCTFVSEDLYEAIRSQCLTGIVRTKSVKEIEVANNS